MRKIKYKKGRKVQPTFVEYTGIHVSVKTEMQLFVYTETDITEYIKFEFENLENLKQDNKVNWLNIHGLNNVDFIKNIGNYLNIDQFILGDILNTTKRTKVEEYHDVLFFNVKSLLSTPNSEDFQVEQISFLLKNDILTSFQEKRSDFFEHIRERLRTNAGIIRSKKADYLMYLLLDAIMENFYITIENEENKVDELIKLSKNNFKPFVIEKVEKHRDNYNFLKRSIIPLRDSLHTIVSIQHDNIFNVIEKENYSFFARLYQKSLELLEQIEDDMTTLESVTNFYFSAQSHKMNEIMKTLTIISSIFIPLTFIVGIYGMNFENMPELKEKNAYFVVLSVLFCITIGMIIYFKKRRWF